MPVTRELGSALSPRLASSMCRTKCTSGGSRRTAGRDSSSGRGVPWGAVEAEVDVASSRSLSCLSSSAPRSFRSSGCGERSEGREGVVAKCRTDRLVQRCLGLNGCAGLGLIGQFRGPCRASSWLGKIVEIRRPRKAAPGQRRRATTPGRVARSGVVRGLAGCSVSTTGRRNDGLHRASGH
jgi:hypothetical protein